MKPETLENAQQALDIVRSAAAAMNAPQARELRGVECYSVSQARDALDLVRHLALTASPELRLYCDMAETVLSRVVRHARAA